MQYPPADDGTRRQRKGTMRRRGACKPCRDSKTKCDGARPCSACRTEKRKSRTCEYSEKVKELAASLPESDYSREVQRSYSSTPDPLESKHRPEGAAFYHAAGPIPRNVRSGNQSSSMYHRLSLSHVIDEFLKVRPPKSSQVEYFGRIQSLSEELRNHNHNPLNPDTPQISADDDNDVDYDYQANLSTANGVAAAWRRRLRTLERWISNGELLRAWHDISSFQRVIQSHELNSSYSLQAHPGLVKAANFIYVRLLELDCMLGFFLGEQSLFPFWKRLKYLSTRLEEIETEDSYYSTKLELFAALHKILQIDMSDDAGVTEFLQYFHKIRTAQPALQFERIATCTPDKEPTNAQELKLFSNLLFMMLYCRTASVAEYYGQQTSMQARNLQPADRDRPSIVNDLRLTGFRSRSLECKQATKHAKFLLAAFERLCEVDSEATAACWFRLHGALIAAVIVGVAGIRERSVEHETGLVKTLPRIRKCFQSLRKLNPQCAVFEWAEAFFNEFDRIRKQAVEKIKSSSTLGRRLSDSASDMSVGVVASRGPSVKIDEDASTPTARRKRSISEVEASTPLVKVKVRKTKGQLRKQHADDCGDVAAQGVNAIQALPSSLTNPQHDAYAYNDTAAMEAYASYPSSVNTSFTEVGAQPSLMQAYAFHYPGPPAELSTEYAIHPPMNLDTEVYDPDRYYLDPALQVNVPWHESVMQNAGFMYGSAPIPSLSPLHPPQPSPAHLSATSMLPPSHILSSPPDKASAGTGFFNMTTENFEAEQASNTHTITGGHNDHRPPYAHTHNDAIQGTAQSAYHYLAPQASPSETSNTPAWQRPALSKQPSQGQGQQQFYEQNAFYPHSATTAFHSHSRHESENEAQSSYAVGQQHHQNQFRGLSMPS